ncbi:XRE family transcriptional regulator [Mesorhizobium caraganae]|uniref:XRE family transcriptional regulator n=1 Tax=Mesorhizobium caraganae TaxID=483206 RepID=UPI00333BDD75
MGRKLDDLIAALPEDRRERVDARFEELRGEVETLGELRRAAGRAQAEIASVLKIKQPSVSKIEKQTDMYLSTLKSYIEAIGGQLELVVHLPSRAPFRIERLGNVVAPKAVSVPSVKRVAGGRNRTKAARVG